MEVDLLQVLRDVAGAHHQGDQQRVAVVADFHREPIGVGRDAQRQEALEAALLRHQLQQVLPPQTVAQALTDGLQHGMRRFSMQELLSQLCVPSFSPSALDHMFWDPHPSQIQVLRPKSVGHMTSNSPASGNFARRPRRNWREMDLAGS